MYYHKIKKILVLIIDNQLTSEVKSYIFSYLYFAPRYYVFRIINYLPYTMSFVSFSPLHYHVGFNSVS